MYSVTLLDMFFASVFATVALLMAYAFGYTCKMERLTKALANETAWGMMMDEHAAAVEQAMALSQHKWGTDKWTLEQNYLSALTNQQKELKKHHREAMKKYKARCNAQLAKQVDTLKQTKLKECWVGMTEQA